MSCLPNFAQEVGIVGAAREFGLVEQTLRKCGQGHLRLFVV
jgi:hypothetical protein